MLKGRPILGDSPEWPSFLLCIRIGTSVPKGRKGHLRGNARSEPSVPRSAGGVCGGKKLDFGLRWEEDITDALTEVQCR